MRRFALLLIALLSASGCTTTATARLGLSELETVGYVDLSRYVGTWYDIASFPQRFQEGCTGTTAAYILRADGDIKVLNRCRRGSLAGKEDSATGRARVADRKTNAKLEVSFFRPFWADYWIIDLAGDYAYAVVGHPSRDYLWILSRTPTINAAVYDSILARLRAQGYEVERLQRTVQDVAVRR
jgi:apolipoprotein D and lipocalin family protein